MSYDRYSKFKSDGSITTVPFIKIPERSTDVYETYDKYRTRLDLLSYKYYGDANYGWLILQANPKLSDMEFSIEDGSQIRIPLPLQQVLTQYENDIDAYRQLYCVD